MEHLSFSKIGQFRNVVTDIKNHVRYSGSDEDGNVIYNNNKLPEIIFNGTIKLHGSNGSVCSDGNDVWAQSRKYVISEGLYGFYDFFKKNENEFKVKLDLLREEHNIKEGELLSIYGEWCGPGVQKKVAINEIPNKIFVIIGLKVGYGEDVLENDKTKSNYWLDHSKIRFTNKDIYNIYEFPHYTKLIDFNNPKLVINELVELTNEVEKECPVAKSFDISGIGEGIVWYGDLDGKRFRFKVKGDAHSNSNTKQLASVDPEKLKNIQEVTKYLVTKPRLEQAINETKAQLDKRYTGDVLRWVANDIIEEESDTLENNDLVWKDIASTITTKFRYMFFDMIDNDF